MFETMNERVLVFNADILENLVCEYKMAGTGEDKISGLERVIFDLNNELDTRRRKPVRNTSKNLKKRPKLIKKHN